MMIPQITSGMSAAQIRSVVYPSLTYRYTSESMAGNVDGIEAIKQTIIHILSTERFSYAIYNDNYGVSLEKYIGNSFDFLEETIQNTLRDALLQDDRITGVEVTGIRRGKTNEALVSFTVKTIIGETDMEVSVNV